MRRDIVDISHRIADGMPVFPGLPRPVVDLHVDHAASRPRYAGRAEFAIGHVDWVGNVGTYLDSPFHRFPGMPDVSELPLDRLVDLPTVVVDARAAAAAGRRLDVALPPGPLAGRAVLVRTGWDARWGTAAYWEPGPYLGPAVVEQLLHHRPALVGVDFWNVDDPDDPARPVHTALLGAGLPIVEHLTRLDGAGDGDGMRTFVVPLAVAGAPSFPVRAFVLNRERAGG